MKNYIQSAKYRGRHHRRGRRGRRRHADAAAGQAGRRPEGRRHRLRRDRALDVAAPRPPAAARRARR